MKKYIKWIILAGVLTMLLAAAGVAVFMFYLPYRNAQSSMPSNATLLLQQNADGTLQLTWPNAAKADYYSVELLVPLEESELQEDEEVEPEVVFRDYVKDATTYVMPEIPTDMELTLRINSVVEYMSGKELRLRMGETPIEVTTTFDTPKVGQLEWIPDTQKKSVDITFQLKEGDMARLYREDENGALTLMTELDSGETVLSFGPEADLPMPDYEDTYRFVLDAYRKIPGLDFYGYLSADLHVVREDLLDRELDAVLTDEGYNVYTLTWDETKGEHYEVQMMDGTGADWTTVCTVDREGERTYTTGHLPIFRTYQFRVVAVGGQTMEGSEFAAVTDPMDVATTESPVYCTVWPVKNLEAYSDAQMTEVVGKVNAGTAYCVLAEEEGMFRVAISGMDTQGYIDSNLCMINLPEYIGDLCSYDITNSYSSLYMVHEYEIPEVTDVVTKGYDRIQMENEKFLVPLLYPTAKKLTVAAKNALEQGYRVKIYDAFRPYVATREIYDLTEEILEEPIPEKTFTNKKVKLPEVEEDEEITYLFLMTNNTWNLGSFLAKSGSMHNLGVAVDLTLETADGREELEMQTSMHDLSWYSVLQRNNSNANLLASIMKGAGLNELVSEWWHFQDNEARQSLALASVTNGVTPECWIADDNGWKYRRYNGTYFYDCDRTIGEVDYTFDAEGYVILE